MNSLSAVFRVLAEMKREGVYEDYAIGGAMAALFYAEPVRTYDLDVFVLLPREGGAIVRLTPIYQWLEARGFSADREHVVVHGVPVRFLPAYNPLTEEAIREARVLEYESSQVRVVSPEHLIAMAVQAGGRRRRERSFLLLESGAVDLPALKRLLLRHELPLEILDFE